MDLNLRTLGAEEHHKNTGRTPEIDEEHTDAPCKRNNIITTTPRLTKSHVIMEDKQQTQLFLFGNAVLKFDSSLYY